MQTPSTAENKMWLWIRFFTNVLLRIRDEKMQNPAGVDPCPPLVWRHSRSIA